MFSFITFLEIIFKNFFYVGHEEKIRAMLTELLVSPNFNIQSLYSDPKIRVLKIKVDRNNYLIQFNSQYKGYYFSVLYYGSGFLYSFFKGTKIQQFFIRKKISIYKDKELIYKNGYKTRFFDDIEVNNIMYFFTTYLQR